jgi:hypothetical protein
VKGNLIKAKIVGNEKKKPTCLQRVLLMLSRIGLVGVLILAGMLAAASVWPSLGAQGADILRGMIGDKAVARLEMEVYQVQDTLQKWKYDLGWATPAAPWGNTPLSGLVSPEFLT